MLNIFCDKIPLELFSYVDIIISSLKLYNLSFIAN